MQGHLPSDTRHRERQETHWMHHIINRFKMPQLKGELNLFVYIKMRSKGSQDIWKMYIGTQMCQMWPMVSAEMDLTQTE